VESELSEPVHRYYKDLSVVYTKRICQPSEMVTITDSCQSHSPGSFRSGNWKPETGSCQKSTDVPGVWDSGRQSIG
jgi:hypothetical protein